MQVVRSILFTISFYLTLILVFVIAIPTLILPKKATLICGKILSYIIIFLLRFILGVRVTFSGIENLKKMKDFLLQVHINLYLKHLYSKLHCNILFLFLKRNF